MAMPALVYWSTGSEQGDPGCRGIQLVLERWVGFGEVYMGQRKDTWGRGSRRAQTDVSSDNNYYYCYIIINC